MSQNKEKIEIEQEIQKIEASGMDAGAEEASADQSQQSVPEKEKLGKRVKNSFTTRKFRGGAYATALSVIAIAMVLVVNLIVTKLDISIDLTSDGKYSLNEETISLLKGLEDDITIYYLVAGGEEITYFDKLFSKYDDYGSKVTLAYKDPVLYPKFAAGYVDDEVTDQSFLVVNETTGRAKYVPYSDLLVMEFDYSTYNYTTTGIDLEGQLDAAIQYVTNENLPVMYAVTGHGETSISSVMSELLEKGNVTTNDITLITEEMIPEDCDILFINQPQNDYTEEEVEMIEKYLMDGGYAIICVDYVTPDLTNFSSLLVFYGLDVQDGMIMEGKSSYYVNQRPYMLLPTVYSSDITDSVRGKKYVIAAYASGITLREDIRDTITTTNLLYTSSSSYIKPVDTDTLEKESGDMEGPFYVGIALSETLADEETKIAVFSAKLFFDDSLLVNSTYGNADILLNTISTFTDQENAVSVPVMSLTEDMLTMTTAQSNRIAVMTAVLLPLCVIGIGIYVVVRRRKK